VDGNSLKIYKEYDYGKALGMKEFGEIRFRVKSDNGDYYHHSMPSYYDKDENNRLSADVSQRRKQGEYIRRLVEENKFKYFMYIK
jgi:hypothetical protein